MLRPTLATWLFVFLCSTSLAQGPAAKAEQRLVAFRIGDWHVSHFEQASAAAQHAGVLKQLGCEVKTAEHNGHTDVQCRTVYWKSLALDTDEQVQQWQSWLRAAGFDTIYGQPVEPSAVSAESSDAPLEIVQFRRVEWAALHAHQPRQMSEYLALYRALGCETKQVKHGEHTDLQVRCATWRQVELPSHEAAHQWQKFLESAGFETAHEH